MYFFNATSKIFYGNQKILEASIKYKKNKSNKNYAIQKILKAKIQHGPYINPTRLTELNKYG